MTGDLRERVLKALAACGGEGTALVVSGSPRGVSPGLLHSLAGACGCVVAVDSGLGWLDSAGIAPNAAVGDMDSVDPAALERLRSAGGTEICRVDSFDKDVTDLELALGFVRERGFRTAVVANLAGGRLDHLLASVGALGRAGMPVAAVDDDAALVPLDAEGARKELSLADVGLAPGDVYSVIALDGSATVSQSGARYPQDGCEVGCLSGLGISNVVEDPDARVSVSCGKAAVIIPFEP